MKKASDIATDYSENLPKSKPPQLDKNQLEAVRSILLAEDRERIEALVAETAALEQKSEDEKEALLLRIQALQDELDRLRELNREGEERADRLQEALDGVRSDLAVDQENRVPFLVGRIGEILAKAAQESRQSIASALSPIMGAAISTQIRNSQDEMVDALQPIILRTVQKAIAEFARDLQRNIDARLKATLGPGGILRSFTTRIRGVDDSELLVRESLPFALDEIFLIQRESGLLVEYDGIAQEEPRETELIGGMLTAIRDFARHSLGDNETGEELDEVQYGDQRIIIEGGTATYVAAVVRGVEPEGFHASLREFVVDLHFNYGQAFRDYEGDATSMPYLKAELNQFRSQYRIEEAAAVKPMSGGERWLLIGGGIAGVIMLALACFYLQFTIALLPVAFGETATPTSTLLPTATVTATHTLTPSPTATSTAEPTETAMFTVTPSLTPEPTATATATATAVPETETPMPTPEPATALVPVWMRVGPGLDSEASYAIPAGTEVTILDSSDGWLEVLAVAAGRERRGWVLELFIDVP